jgi:putative ATPase
MKDVGYGKGYKYAHNFPGHIVEQQHLPDSLKDKKFYFPGELGYEKLVNDRLKAWSAIKKINDSDRKKKA